MPFESDGLTQVYDPNRESIQEAPALYLQGEAGPCSGQVFKVYKSAMVLGRDEGADVHLSDASVSRHHASLRRDGERWLLADLNSHNGTILEGRRIVDEVEVKVGQCFSMGRAQLRLTEDPVLLREGTLLTALAWLRIAAVAAIVGAIAVWGVQRWLRATAAASPSAASTFAISTPVSLLPEPMALSVPHLPPQVKLAPVKLEASAPKRARKRRTKARRPQSSANTTVDPFAMSDDGEASFEVPED